MAPKTKINLKERLEDGELDLSLSDLQEVPVREIALLKKATSLDLSNNRLTSLGKNFSILTHIVKLDLSKNLLNELPEDFGELKQLKHLDLYSNNLTHLPLSFYKLKSLRWLDLKNNPLVPALAKVAGPCLDASQCIQCSRSIVTFLTQMHEQVEEEKAKRELQRQEDLAAEASQQKLQKKKEKKKTKKEKKIKVKPEKNQEIPQAIPVEDFPAKCSNKPKIIPAKTNFCATLLKFIFLSIIVSMAILFVFSSLKLESSVLLKQKTVEVWNEAVKSVPSDYKPWASKLEDHVFNLHSMTGKVAENMIVFVDEVRKDKRVNATVCMLWDTLVVVGTESKRIFVDLGDQAVIWTNEIKKNLKL